MHEQDQFKEIVWQRSLPLRYHADVAVIGGGIAGIGAACAAASEGASVILVERFGVTGGNATVGGVANWSGEMAGLYGEEWKNVVPTWKSVIYNAQTQY